MWRLEQRIQKNEKPNLSYVPWSKVAFFGDGRPPTFNDGILIMGPYKTTIGLSFPSPIIWKFHGSLDSRPDRTQKPIHCHQATQNPHPILLELDWFHPHQEVEPHPKAAASFRPPEWNPCPSAPPYELLCLWSKFGSIHESGRRISGIFLGELGFFFITFQFPFKNNKAI